MPDKRIHRGPNPADAKLFAPEAIPDLGSAIADFSLLLSKGYAEKSGLKLVGDRFGLTDRQRTAVMRCACSDQQLASRKSRQVSIADIKASPIAIDGYNLLITIEAAISGAIILKGRDGCFRDLASIHGTYRRVTETIPALQLIGDFLAAFSFSKVLWLLDSPVSNSGRLKTLIAQLAERNNWKWDIQLATNPDMVLIKSDFIAASSDSVVLDNCKEWVNLGRGIIEAKLPGARIADLG